jgi:hypothetical protein
MKFLTGLIISIFAGLIIAAILEVAEYVKKKKQKNAGSI